jgi:hypothetical protein
MGKKFLTTITLPNLSSPPSSPSVGDMYFDTTLGKIGVYTSSGWVYYLYQIEDGSVTTTKIADGAVTSSKLASGAAVANLGYTPVNKAGDTMSGSLTVPSLLGPNDANLLINGRNYGVEIRIDEDSSGSDIFRITRGSSGSTTLMLVQNTGNVGIGTNSPTQKLDVAGNIKGEQFISTAATGTAPFQVNSTTKVNNLNADLLDGYDSTDFARKAENATITGNWTFNNNLDVQGATTLAGRTFRKVSFVPSSGAGWYRIIANANVFGGRLDIYAEWNARVSRITLEGYSAGWGNMGYFTATQVFHYDSPPLITVVRWGQSGGDSAYLDIYVNDTTNNNNTPINLYFWGDAWYGIQTTPQFNPSVGTTNYLLNLDRKGGSTYNQNVKILGSDYVGWGHRLIEFRTDSDIIQWGIGHTNIPGSNNSGNDFAIWNYDNSGSYISRPLTIKRNNGFIGINSPNPEYRLVVEESNSRIATVIRKTNNGSGSGGALDGPTLLVENSYGNHSWGNLAEFRIENNGGADPPHITFTAGWTSTGWAVGMAGINDADFGIASNRGWRFGDFGTLQLRVKPDGQLITRGTITPGISSGFAGHINSSGPIKFSNGSAAQEIYVRKIRASASWATNDANDPGDGGGFFSGNLIVNGTITGNLSANSVGTAQLTDNAVTTQKIADGAVTASKLAPGAASKIFQTTIGDGTNSSYTVAHNLNTTNVEVSLILLSTNEKIGAKVEVLNVNQVKISFISPIAANSVKVVVLG